VRARAALAIKAGVICALFCGGIAFARREGGGSEVRRPLPHPGDSSNADAGASESPSADQPTANRLPTKSIGPAREVEARFVERLGDAKIDAPNIQAGEYRLAAHWRKMQVPWLSLPTEAARYATSIALQTSDEETQWAMPQSNGGLWTPSAKVWNMNEGAYDMRQAIFAPTPATFSFRVTIPPDSTFQFSPALVPWINGQTEEPLHGSPKEATWAVVIDAGHGEEPVCDKTISLIETPALKGWQDVTCDLSKWAGRDVELRLKTTSPKGRDVAALALWGNPTLLAKRQPRVPYNVLWVVVDAMRPDVLASFHDDAADEKMRHAHLDPGFALLPKIPGLMPNLDGLSLHATRFSHAHSNAPWTRPGTLAMLSGSRSTELGIGTTNWIVPENEAKNYYTGRPPLLPLLMRNQGVVTRAFVNNFFMAGYAEVGVDMGFERLDDHRHRTLDTKEITESAVNWLQNHADERFFAFCNYNSPHEPYEPPKRFADRVPEAPAGPGEWIPREYMAEAAKDDEAIGTLLKTLDDLKLRDHTIVVVTADHGETLSAAHQGRLKLDNLTMRFHHAMGNYEETTRIPILISLPGVVPENKNVTDRVRIIDIAPTLMELEGLAPAAKMSGKSLLPLMNGTPETDERVTLSEGRDTRAILTGKWHFIERRGDAQEITIDGETKTVLNELYDLDDDPGETHNIAKDHKDVVAEMMARIKAAAGNVPVAGTNEAVAPDPVVTTSGGSHFRFAGGGEVHRISGRIVATAPAKIDPVNLPATAISQSGEGGALVDFSFVTVKDAVVGFDITTPPGSPMSWTVYLDDAPWPEHRIFGGPFGLESASLSRGLLSDEARAAAVSSHVAEIDPQRDLGLFVTIDGSGAGSNLASAPSRAKNGAAASEMNQMLKQWGYAH
jgi:arylsulfatase A-like enzyme